MTTAEKILVHIKRLPESAQGEVLDFVEYLESRAGVAERQADSAWSVLSLSQAMRGMESEEAAYSVRDLREVFS